MLFVNSAFLQCLLRSYILRQNCFASFVSGCWIVFMHSPPTCWWNLFSLILECLVLFVLFDPVSIPLNLPFFRQYLQLVLSDCLLFCFDFFIQKHYLSVLLGKSPIEVLYFCLDSFREHKFYQRLLLFPQKLARLIQ